MKYPNCANENPDGMKFCGECGQLLEKDLTCSQCSYLNPQNVKIFSRMWPRVYRTIRRGLIAMVKAKNQHGIKPSIRYSDITTPHLF